MEIQHVNVKLFLEHAEELDLAPLIPVFHRWIQTQWADELLLDVADYRHVHAGPGVVLIGHQGNYSVDCTGGRMGVRYNRKAPVAGNNQDCLAQATRSALTACQRLASEPELRGAFRFNGCELEVSVNDRRLAPNTPQTRSAADADLRPFLATLLAGAEYSTSYPNDPRDSFSIHVTASRTFDTTSLLNNLNSMMPVLH
jgi:hypothetical protein